MGAERAHRLDAERPRVIEATDPAPREPEVPGKRTEVERALAQLGLLPSLPREQRQPKQPGRRTLVELASPERLGFEDYRVLALRELLERLEPDPALHRAVLAAADRTVARR